MPFFRSIPAVVEYLREQRLYDHLSSEEKGMLGLFCDSHYEPIEQDFEFIDSLMNHSRFQSNVTGQMALESLKELLH